MRLAAACSALLVVATATPAAANGKAALLTPETAREKVTLNEDPLDIEGVLSTRDVLRSTRGVLRTPYNDNHLRAYVDRKTGETRFEVRQTLQYMGSYRDFGHVNYETSSWPTTAKLRKVESNQPACDAIDPQSSCFEEVSFVVGEAELRRLAAGYQPGAENTWSFKFKPDQGREERSSLNRAEIAGLLQAVDAYRHRLAAGQSLALASPGAE
ncbi:MAG: hypothetical protein KKG89_18890 [Alphaproteobacteria bacterium]|nr:hypothetical protein [Alphaproteobacteria bacterium]